MKVYIGPYKNFIGPYQIAEILCFWAKNEKDELGIKCKPDWVHDFGKWLAEDKNGNDSWLAKFCQWVDNRRSRNIKIKLHPYDSWNADVTIAMIAAPLLKQLKETKHGSPFVDDSDVPEHLRSTAAPPKENEYDIDENHHARWDWVLGEMIWAMEELANGKPGEDKFYDHTESNKERDLAKSISKLKVDDIGLEQYHKRLQKGCELFGKYFQGLWD